MKPVYIATDNIISPLGFDSANNIKQINQGVAGIKQHSNTKILPYPFYASIIDTSILNKEFGKIGKIADYTPLEKMMILGLNGILEQSCPSTASSIPSYRALTKSNKTALIISTTKGNVDALATDAAFPKERAYLPELGKKIQTFFGFKQQPIIVSNACVSGILSIAIAKRLIRQGAYENIWIVGGDTASAFILSGFNSFKAISPNPCKPFCKNRTGITLGEAAAAVLVTADESLLGKNAVEIVGDSSCNDANHISGPSRTGEGLYRSMQAALKEAKLNVSTIDYISAHGTATPFNDEMEAIAMNRIGLADVPLNSLKGYYGHTLGAAGLLETIVGIHSLHNNRLYASKGFEKLGVSQPVNVIEKTSAKKLRTFLKTASGFGGCNTAVVFRKN